MPRDPKFIGTIGYIKQGTTGATAYSDRKGEKTREEVLDDMEKADILDDRSSLVATKIKAKEAAIRKQGEPNPKRYTVDPKTGKIDVDEEEGEYTKKDALVVSASLEGKSGQAEKPKEFYVDPETGTIIKDTENGEYTLSEARTISQSLQKEKQAAQLAQRPKSLENNLGEVLEEAMRKRFANWLGGDNNPPPPKDLAEELIKRHDQDEKLRQIYGGNPGGGGAQALAQSGMRGEIMKLLLEDERDRLKMQYDHETQVERNKHLGVMASTVKENFADGIQALKMAAQEAQKAGVSSPAKPEEAPPQAFACSCGMKFSAPAGWAGQALKCPNPACGKEYSKEALLG